MWLWIHSVNSTCGLLFWLAVLLLSTNATAEPPGMPRGSTAQTFEKRYGFGSSGVPGRFCEEGCDEGFEECFSAFSGVVNELEEADVERHFFL